VEGASAQGERTGGGEAAPGPETAAAADEAGSRASAASGGGTTPAPAAGDAAGGWFRLTYPATEAKISLTKPASSIEDALVPPGLYRDYSRANLSAAGSGAEIGGGRTARQAVPRARRSAGRGGVAIKLPSLDFKPWAGQVLEKIQKNWALPGGSGSGWKGEVGVRVTVAGTGQVLGIDLDAPTKIELLDQAALKAVAAASPFPALPDAFTSSSLEVYFVFRYGD